MYLIKIAEQWESFSSYKQGYRYYTCEKCGKVLKAIEAAAHVVTK